MLKLNLDLRVARSLLKLNSNTTLVKVKLETMVDATAVANTIQIQLLLKLNCIQRFLSMCWIPIQIQLLLKLNSIHFITAWNCSHSNTTLVKVKSGSAVNIVHFMNIQIQLLLKLNWHKWYVHLTNSPIQIQLLLKLNARKINLYDFIVLLKVLINKDFTYFLPAIMRFEGI